MNQPSPAIVAQRAVRRLPRIALWLFCIAYVLPGFVGREPWKSADMTAFGYMLELAHGQSNWFNPLLTGLAPSVDGPLSYWLGAWAVMLAPEWIAPDFAARIPFILLLSMTLVATWYATYYLARSPQAQPVAFAFGGEANAPDYARAIADGGLLAFIASLGLAQLSHETTPAVAQLCFTAVTFFAFSAMNYRVIASAVGGVAGLAGLGLSGAPTLAVLLGLGGALIHVLDRNGDSPERKDNTAKRMLWAWSIVCAAGGVAALASILELWHWRIDVPGATWADWRGIGRLLLWFTWPAWPLAIWTVWRWRLQLGQLKRGILHRHLALPLWWILVMLGNTVLTGAGDRALLLALPALAALAAFALPTLSRSVSALVDWFTLLFFTGCAIIIWVVWIAMQTGVPPQPAANVARLAPGFVHSFTYIPFLLAIAATIAWAWLVKWRVGRHQAAIWKSLVLPASGAALCWVLLMTLWLPLLDFARSYTVLAQSIKRVVGDPECVEIHALDRGQIAAFQFHAKLKLRTAATVAKCNWLLVDRDATASLARAVDMTQWTPQYFGYRPSDRDDDVLLYRRLAQAVR